MAAMLRSDMLPLLGLALVAGCGAAGRAPGGECFSDPECESGLCVANRCLVPDADEDHDGLSNADERRWSTDPFHADTDRDGKPDGAEVGAAATPADGDGDGRIDAVESAAADVDADCLVDEVDARDGVVATPSELAAACPARPGVCSGRDAVGKCSAGTLTCAVDGPDFESTEATCDGLDNDCDGATDEGLGGQGSAVGSTCDGVGECGQGLVECRGGVAACSTNPGGSQAGAAAEECNGKDDDCDGETDEELHLAGRPEGPGLGEVCLPSADCLPGVVECAGGALVCSTGPGGSRYVGAPELCDGLDDDCDGLTDEDYSSIGQPCGQGACAGGVMTCRPDLVGVACSTASLASEESCNGSDDDCDGDTDEPGDLAPGASGCPGLGVCSAPGAITGQCAGGIWSCVAAPGSGYEPGEELTCDGLDNDCDGLTDEGFTWAPPDGADPLPVGAACGAGACAGGIVTCLATGAACTTVALAGPEICNGKDDDCDGATDEGLGGLALGAPCDGTGECGPGVVACSTVTGLTTCSTNPDGPASGAKAEVCNGKDDDCDGVTDPLPDVLAEACLGPGVCGAGGGTPQACTDGALVCDFSAVSGYEGPTEASCDGADNDCDGLVDELLGKKPATGWDKLAAGTPPPRIETIAAFDPDGKTIVVTSGGTSLPSPDGPVPSALGDTFGYHLGSETWDELGVGGPPPRSGATLVADPAATRLVLFGGQDPQGGKLGDAWQVDTQAWGWTEVWTGGMAPTPRSGHAAVVDPATRWMWVVGGVADAAGKAVAALDLDTGKWIAAVPEGPGWRDGTAAAYDPGGRIFAFGGQADDGTLLGDRWILDLGELKWIPPKPGEFGPPPRRDHRMAVSGGALWLFGGTNAKGEALGDLWRLDLDTLAWELLALPDGPAPRRSPAFVATSGDIRLLGGSAAGHAFDDAWRLTTDAPPAWTPLGAGQLPPPRADGFLAMVPVTGRLLLQGGRRVGLETANTLSDLWAREPDDGGGWTLLSSAGPARWRSAAAYDPTGGRIYVHGGTIDDGGTPSSEMDVWDGEAWTAIDDAVGQPALVDHGATWDRKAHRMLLYGGVTVAGLDSATLWSFDPAPEKAQAPFEVVTTAGDGPGSVHGNVLLYDGSGSQDRLVAVGGVGSDGKVRLLDLGTLVWSALPNPVPALAGEKPLVLLDEASGSLFAAAGGSAWLVKLDSGEITPWPTTATPAALLRAAAAYDPYAGHGYLFGGTDADGRTRDSLWALPFVCSP